MKFGSNGNYTLLYKNIDLGSPLYIDATYIKDGSKEETTVRTTITNKWSKFTRLEGENGNHISYDKPYFIDNSQKLGSFVLNKATYLTKQDVFTNDYSNVSTITDIRNPKFTY